MQKRGKCVFDDIVNELAVKLEEADGLVIGSPVYYGSANGTLMSAQDARGVPRHLIARNMVFLMKSISLGKVQIGLPEIEDRVWTNFTR